jgi:hypothetical protein
MHLFSQWAQLGDWNASGETLELAVTPWPTVQNQIRPKSAASGT